VDPRSCGLGSRLVEPAKDVAGARAALSWTLSLNDRKPST
jgi:hypothetical protein